MPPSDHPTKNKRAADTCVAAIVRNKKGLNQSSSSKEKKSLAAIPQYYLENLKRHNVSPNILVQNMMAMSLYGGPGTGGSPYHPFSPPPVLATNPVERGARRLPRPKRSRRKKQKEISLYPSVAAVEEAVPETIISYNDNGKIEISLTKEEEERREAAARAGEEEEAMEEDADEEDNPLDRKPAASPYHRKKDSSLSLLGRRRSSMSSTSSSMSSSSSETKLNQEFRKLSVKRKPVASAPWPIDDEDVDPLGGILSTAPRRKVSRHASRDSHHSRSSVESHSVGDNSSIGSIGSSGPKLHRRTGTYDSIPMVATVPSTELQPPPKGRKSSSKKSATLASSKRKTAPPLRRMKSWHDDEQSAQKRAQELEIEPGFFLPLRGSDETLEALKTGFFEEIFCQACDVELLCIADASFCVCPDCKCISPVDGIASLSASSQSKYTKGSVGLGLKASNRG